MIPVTFNVYPKESYPFQDGKIRPYTITEAEFGIQPKILLIGLDPGNRNMGITIIPPSWFGPIISVEIRMEPERDPVNRIFNIYQMVYQFVGKELPQEIRQEGYAVIEGASFGDKFRQVELAEARTASLMALSNLGLHINILPPISIRKKVFGAGKIKGENLWKHLLPSNAASSLVCALCAAILSCQ